MKDLAFKLGVSRHEAVGLINDLWEWAGQFTPQGDIGRYSDAVIADGIEWSGDPEKFVKSLVDSGWVDRCSSHRLVIHDWEEHCEGWIKKRVQRSGLEFVSAVPTVSACESDNGRQRQTTAAVVGKGGDRLGQAKARHSSSSENEECPSSPVGASFWPRVFEALPPPMRTGRMEKAWLEWEQHRREIRKKLTVTSVKKQAKELAEMNDEQRAIDTIETSIRSGWTGLFEGQRKAGGTSGPAGDQTRQRRAEEARRQGAEEIAVREL